MFPKSTQSDLDERLIGFIKNAGYKKPTLLQQSVLPQTLLGRDIAIEAGPGEGRTGLLIISLLIQLAGHGDGLRSLVIVSDDSEVYKVMRQYRRFSARFHGRPHIAGLGTDENVAKETKLLARNPDIAVGTSQRIIDHLRRESISLQNVQFVALIVPEKGELEGFEKDVQYIFSKLPEKYVTQVYGPNPEALSFGDVLRRPIQIAKTEWCRVDELNGKEQKEEKMRKSRSGKHPKAKEYIKSILQAIKEQENPHELNEFRRIFRRHTPLHLRAYVAAYLIKEAVGSTPGSQGEYKTLFVSIGKNRKVFPKDFERLFTSQLGITDAEIGDIKVLDNYSFVDIADSHAQKAIDTLNGTDFRGRKLTVNYARKKREKRG